MPESKMFAGKKVLITGASSGIGAESAVRFGEAGAYVLVHFNRGKEAACGVLTRVRDAGGDGEIVQADLSTMEGTQRLVGHVAGSTIDVLVNNAGSLIRRTPVLEMKADLWEQVFLLNLTSAFFLTQAVLPGMVAKEQGYIVNVSSVAARTGGGVGALAYAASKAALSTMTKGLTKEFAHKGIRANCVSPGTIDTNYHSRFSNEQMLSGVRSATPLGRLGASKEIADIIVYLCSPGASFLHGQVIEVNGGFLMA